MAIRDQFWHFIRLFGVNPVLAIESFAEKGKGVLKQIFDKEKSQYAWRLIPQFREKALLGASKESLAEYS